MTRSLHAGDSSAPRPRLVTDENTRVSSGISGLDEVLRGGFIRGRSYLVRGAPGTGKTILGLHFLTACQPNEHALCISLEEPEAQLRKDARALGIDLRRVTFLDLTPSADFFTRHRSYDIFSPADVERDPTTQRIVQQVESLRPARVFLEALTQFRYLSPDGFQFHKQVLSFLHFLQEREATVLFSSEGSAAMPDDDLQFIADGVIHLDATTDGRALRVLKFRGSDFAAGSHAMRISERGVEVFPKLVPQAHGRPFIKEEAPSGVPELDEMLGGGMSRGMVTLITGPTGVGKTTVGMQFMKEAAGRGERSVLYCFDEARESVIERCRAINVPILHMLERGTLSLVAVEPLRYSADELARMVRTEVEEHNTRLVMVDSVAGYRLCIRGGDLVRHLHALCAYLKNMRVTTVLINEVEAITGSFRVTEHGISYMADDIMFLRYFESDGEVHKAIGVLKKRAGEFQSTVRELEITRFGLRVGPPLRHLRGLLTGTTSG